MAPQSVGQRGVAREDDAGLRPAEQLVAGEADDARAAREAPRREDLLGQPVRA